MVCGTIAVPSDLMVLQTLVSSKSQRTMSDGERKPGSALPTMKDITLFGRRVSGGRTMGEGADVACKAHTAEFKECEAKNGTGSPLCKQFADAVLECKGSFLCPALSVQWVRCLQNAKKGVSCDSEKAALEACMNCNSTE